VNILHLLALVGSCLLILIGLIVKKAIEVAIEKEYGSWAPLLAHLLVWLAGVICPSMGPRWSAELQFVQEHEHRDGLFEATSCFVCAPYFALREAARKVQAALVKATSSSPARKGKERTRSSFRIASERSGIFFLGLINFLIGSLGLGICGAYWYRWHTFRLDMMTALGVSMLVSLTCLLIVSRFRPSRHKTKPRVRAK
jgi:hypothetical protein